MIKARPMVDHTGAQVAAADPSQSVWVSANAGTGKTHVLIERILRLLLTGTPPGKILCLTYTKAAAAEAATRLSERLGRWAAAGDKDLADDLSNLLGRASPEAETERARALFPLTLETPEGVTIRTIHSFCESLLGRFPLEAKIAPHFTVIDDRLAREILAEAETQLLADQKGTPAAVTQALSLLAGLVNQDDFRKLMKELDSKRSQLRRMLEVKGGVAGVMAGARAEMGLSAKDTVARVLGIAAADGAFDHAGLEQAAAALDKGSDSDHERAADIRAWLALEAADRAEAFLAGYAQVFATQKETAKAEKNIITKKAKETDPGALDILMAEQDRVVATLLRLRSVRLADATEALLTVGERLIAGYETAKRARAFLDYDDLIEKAAELLSDGEDVSWVHYKLDGGIDHILVDEAQDTGSDSWDVIWRLSGDFFTGEGAGDRPIGRTVFAVGDEKQSIYSFQGAAPARFGIMRERYHDRIADTGSRLQDVELALSYRSTGAVLRTVDHVFARPEAADGLTWGKKAIRHDSNRTSQGGLVELWPTLTPEEEPERLPWDAPVDQTSPESPEARLAERIAGTISRWRRDGEILESAGRAIEYGDILILIRTRRTFADRMVQALERRDIPVTGRDRLKLMDHLAVMDLVAAGRFALLPDDNLNIATVLKGPFVGFDDDALFDLAHDRKESLWRTLGKHRDETPAFAAAQETLSRLLAAADRTPPYEFFSSLLSQGGRLDLLARLGVEAAEPIDEFLSLALDFERDHQPSLEGFLHWLESGEREVKREMESGRNEVRVLTVHGAKGLEAPIVFLPDTCSLPLAQLDNHLQWKMDDEGKGFVLWRMRKDDEDDLARTMHEAAREETMREHRRLLYVAMTRARDRLYVGGWEGKRKRPEGCWYDLIAPVVEGKGKEITLADGEKAWRVLDMQKDTPDGEAGAALVPDEEAPPDWTRTPPPPEPEPSRPLAPSRPSGEEPPIISPLGDDDGARFKRGLLVHRLLQSLPDLAPGERQAQGRAYLSRPIHELSRDEQEEILTETLGVMDHPDHAAVFGPGSLAEVPLTGIIVKGGEKGSEGGGSHVMSGQLDRLLVTDDAVTVIDYKTNRPPPETEDAVDPAYLRQMAAYREVLREIYPGRPVRAVLLWTVGPRMMALGDDILDAHAP